jgi:hypothetical protein
MKRRSDALIVGLWVIAIACATAAIWAEERRGFLVLALITGSLAAYASYRRTR